MTGKITAPFTATQVDALNRFQRAGFVHPFTCGNEHDGDRTLVATRLGWICCHCDYRQDWAHAGMLAEPVDPVAELRAQVERANVVHAVERSLVRQIVLGATPGEGISYRLRENLLAEIDKLPILDAVPECKRRRDGADGWKCDRCESIWHDRLHVTGWRPPGCPERVVP